MSKSHVFTNSRKLLAFGTILVILSLALAACSANPIPETGGTPGVDDLTPAVGATEPVGGGLSTEPAGGTAVTPTVEATTQSPTVEATKQSPTMGATSEGTSVAGEEVEVKVVNDPTLGEILVAKDSKTGEDMTLYAFTNDTENTVTCDDACQVQWPPLITQGSPKAGVGVDETLLSTASLPDGQLVVTYNGHPLYFYAGDTAAGDVNGQGLNGKWYVVSPDGELVQQ